MNDLVLNLILFAAALLTLAYGWSGFWRWINTPQVPPKRTATLHDLRARARRRSATVTKWPGDRGAA
jgi:hypothetical protein